MVTGARVTGVMAALVAGHWGAVSLVAGHWSDVSLVAGHWSDGRTGHWSLE